MRFAATFRTAQPAPDKRQRRSAFRVLAHLAFRPPRQKLSIDRHAVVEEFEGGVAQYMPHLMTHSDTTALVTPGDACFSHLIVENGLAARHPVLVIDGAEVAIVKPVMKEFAPLWPP